MRLVQLPVECFNPCVLQGYGNKLTYLQATQQTFDLWVESTVN